MGTYVVAICFQTELPTYFSQLKKQRWLNFKSFQPHISMLTASKSYQQLSCKKSVFCPNNFLMDLISWQLFYITVLWWVILSRIPYTHKVQKIQTNFLVFLDNLNLTTLIIWDLDLTPFNKNILFCTLYVMWKDL